MNDDPFTHLPSRRRRGFTIVELLVLLGIIGLLMAILVPAIQSARETSRQARCKNNLRQIGIALLAYESAYRCLPLASIHGRLPGIDPNGVHDGFGWGTFILPFLDQGALYNKIDPHGDIGLMWRYYNQHGTIIPGGDTRLAIYRCPSSILPDVSTNIGPRFRHEAFLGYGTSDYKGCQGHRHGADGVMIPVAWCHGDCPIRLRAVRDGASATIMVGESSIATEWGRAWPMWIGAPAYRESVIFQSFATPFSDGLNYGITNKSLATQFWTRFESRSPAFSYHPGGVQFLLVDGSTKFLSDTIDADTYYALTGRNDGIPVGEF